MTSLINICTTCVIGILYPYFVVYLSWWVTGLQAKMSPQKPLTGRQTKQTIGALKYVSEELRANRAFMLECILKDPKALLYAGPNHHFV